MQERRPCTTREGRKKGKKDEVQEGRLEQDGATQRETNQTERGKTKADRPEREGDGEEGMDDTATTERELSSD